MCAKCPIIYNIRGEHKLDWFKVLINLSLNSKKFGERFSNYLPINATVKNIRTIVSREGELNFI